MKPKSPPFALTPNAIKRRKVLMRVFTPRVGIKSALKSVVLWEMTYGSSELMLEKVVEYSRLAVQTLNVSLSDSELSTILLQTLLRNDTTLEEEHDPVGLAQALMLRMHPEEKLLELIKEVGRIENS